MQDAASTYAELQGADVLLVGIRQPAVINARYIRDGCVIIDLGLSSCSPLTSSNIDTSEEEAPSQPKGVLCLCCSDGLAAITAALRMRNASVSALLMQGESYLAAASQ